MKDFRMQASGSPGGGWWIRTTEGVARTNFQADCEEIKVLYDFKKDRNEYKFHPFFWQVGGKYTYPQDKDKIYYHHRRGFEDCFEHPQNIPFRSCL